MAMFPLLVMSFQRPRVMSVLNLHFILLGIDIHGNFDYSDVLSGLTGEVANETKFRVFVIN